MLTGNGLGNDSTWLEAVGELSLADLALAYRKAKIDAFYERAVLCREAFAKFEFGVPGEMNAQSPGTLQRNLTFMLERLKRGDFKAYLSELAVQGNCESGENYELLPKSLKSDRARNSDDRHLFVSDAQRAFNGLKNNNKISADLRLLGNFPVELHILSALWINTVGHRIDACLKDCAYGSRLRRIAREQDEPLAVRPYHLRAPGLFEPYIHPYKRWRDSGTHAIRSRLESDESVLVISMDLKSYYPSVDLRGFRVMDEGPSSLWSTLGFDENNSGKEPLAYWEKQFTQWLLDAIAVWQDDVKANLRARGIGNVPPIGLPIGLSATRLLANAYLHKLDCKILESLTPIYYGRYVDDLLLVVSDPGNLESHEDVLRHLASNVDCIQREKPKEKSNRPKQVTNELRIELGYSRADETELKLKPEKMRVFMLAGQSGMHMLDSIQSQLRDVSSERRFMPEPDFLERGPAAEVLTAAGTVEEEPDGLRQAEGLSIKRLSWSVLLHKAERLSVDLKPNEWSEDRKKFYEFAQEHVLRPDRILSHWDTLPRLIGLAIACEDDKEAALLLQRGVENLEKLADGVRVTPSGNVILNGTKISEREATDYLFGRLNRRFLNGAREAIIASWSWGKYRDDEGRIKLGPKQLNYWKRRVWKLCLSDGQEPLGDARTKQLWGSLLRPLIRQVVEGDLARRPRTEFRANHGIDWSVYGSEGPEDEAHLLKCEPLRDAEFAAFWCRGDTEDVPNGLDPVLRDFVFSTTDIRLATSFRGQFEPVSSYWFPTRPYSVRSIAEYAPWCLNLTDPQVNQSEALGYWARYVQALRGIWVKPSLLDEPDDEGSGGGGGDMRRVRIGSGRSNKTPRIALTNLRVDYEYWRAAASGKPIESRERYAALASIVRQVIKLNPRPDYAVFPELSIPRAWIHSLSDTLLSSGISVIAGVEYLHMKESSSESNSTAQAKVQNSACLALTDDRLGYPSSAVIWHPKGVAAPEEEHELLSKFGKELDGQKYDDPKYRPVISHRGFEFGVLICSELLNINHRARYQGNVDCLFILSWNQDLRTFSSMVESAAQDVHAYTVIVNNREFGDSRARIPAKVDHKRDLCRIRGGQNDYAVVVSLDLDALRRFQSRMKRWTVNSDPFKPVPEGFLMADYRWTTPK